VGVASPSRPPPTPHEGFTGSVACTLVGITYRQLDYWDRTGLVSPSVHPAVGSGSRRSYGFDDLVELRIVKRLLDAGVSLGHIRVTMQRLRHALPVQDRVAVNILSDGERVHVCRSGVDLAHVLASGRAVFGIAVGRVVTDTRADLARLGLPLRPRPHA
jgi:DNA-binding transcriptional MerR regulator